MVIKSLIKIFVFNLAYFFMCYNLQADDIQQIQPVHAIAMHGSPKYPFGFPHFDYVNPKAPKKGKIRLGSQPLTSFDNFNPFILKGIAPVGISYTFDTLGADSADEPFTKYGLIAKSFVIPKDRAFIIFNINPDARFADGEPVTAYDVEFTFNSLITQGSIIYRVYYSDVDKVQVLDKYSIKFTFKNKNNTELPLILCDLPVLPKHYFANKDFASAFKEPILGSGPYKVKDFEFGRFVTYELNKNYWAKDLNVNKGFYNFKEIKYDYYKDETVAMQAFIAGKYDYHLENVAKRWATSYNFDAVKNGKVILKEIPNEMPKGMQGFVFNTRKEIFKNKDLRKAIALAFDFEWANKHLFYGQYKRTKSFFANSYLAYENFSIPKTDGSGNTRENLLEALKLLENAGFVYQNGAMKNRATDMPLEFEILLSSNGSSAWERICLPFIDNLKKIGINAKIRVLDLSVYKQRIDNFDYDMFVAVWGQSLSPGNEQKDMWGSASANKKGSQNYAGIQDENIDKIIDKIIKAKTTLELAKNTKALDKMLLEGHYVIPQWHIPYDRIAYKNNLKMPNAMPMKGHNIMNWWIDEP